MDTPHFISNWVCDAWVNSSVTQNDAHASGFVLYGSGLSLVGLTI